MSTAPIFVDVPLAYPDTADENTVIADFWLDFISVRRAEEEFPPQSLPPLDPQRLSVRERMKHNLLFTAFRKLF